MPNVVTLDFETYYDDLYSLKKLTSIEYVLDKRFEVISCAIKINDKTPECFFGFTAIAEAFSKVDWSNAYAVGHNMSEFDALVLAWVFGINPRKWMCTRAMAAPFFAKTGSLSLKDLAVRLNLPAKGSLEATGTKGKHLVDFTLEERDLMACYNIQDVVVTDLLMRSLIKQLPTRELRLIDITIRMLVNPQIELDVELLKDTLYKEEQRRAVMFDRLANDFNMSPSDFKKALASPIKFSGLLTQLGVTPPTKKSPSDASKKIPALAKTDKAMQDLLNSDNPRVASLADARINAKSTILSTRVERMLRANYDGKLPIPLRYCGTSTWRWSGIMGYNAQNLPRISGNPSDCLRNSLQAPEGYKLVVCDLSGIELRVNHFLWKVPSTMELYTNDPQADLYRAYAVKVMNVASPEQVTKSQRQYAKLCMLSLGYQTGSVKFRELARQNGIDLSPKEATEAVNTWREAFSEVVDGWNKCHAALEAVQARTLAPIDDWGLFEVCDSEPAIRFKPRGTLITYPDLSFDGKEWAYSDTGSGKTKIFGGKICENLVSHISRHVLTDAILNFEELSMGKYPLAHMVHDEVIYVVPEEEADSVYDMIKQVLSTPPTWWPELVTYSEGGVGYCYGGIK